MSSINGVDFSKVVSDALKAAKGIADDDGAWSSIKDILKNVATSLEADVQLIAKRKMSGEFNEDDARIFLEDQKMVARIRIRSIAIIGLHQAERIWNAMAEVFRAAIKQALGWTVI